MLKLGLSKALGLLGIGAALFAGGVALIYPPAALILLGGGVVVFALMAVDV